MDYVSLGKTQFYRPEFDPHDLTTMYTVDKQYIPKIGGIIMEWFKQIFLYFIGYCAIILGIFLP